MRRFFCALSVSLLQALGVLLWGLTWGAILAVLTVLVLTGLYKDPCDADGVAVHSPVCDALIGQRR